MIHAHIDNLVPDFVKRFEPYIPSKPDDLLKRFYGCQTLYRLNNNENPLGPPPAAAEIIRTFPPSSASIYPSGDSYHLRTKIADRLQISPDQILVGNGANEVISFIIKAFCREGDNIVTADKTFAVYEWVAEFSGFEARLVPLKEYGFDDQGLLAQVDERTKIIFICNPNNPTGTYWNKSRLEMFLDRLAGSRIVVVDEAYFEFCQAEDYPDATQLIERYPNLVVFRTFSKMYALAGLRIGYLVGSPEVVDVVRRTCVVYSVNSVAQQAALAALEDDGGHISRTQEMVAWGKDFLWRELSGLGLEVVTGQGNFVMTRLPISDAYVYQKLMARGVMVRTMTGFRFPNWIRISISHSEALEACIKNLTQILNQNPY
jgi:histidinol-phosphate aminotransferase